MIGADRLAPASGAVARRAWWSGAAGRLSRRADAQPAIAAGRLVRQALAWWFAELTALTPRPLLRLLGQAGDPTTVLELGASETVLFVAERGRRTPVLVPLTGCGDAELRSRVVPALRNRGADARAAIRLDRSLVFTTSIELPLTAERFLRSILQHQIERLVPLAAAEVCFEYRLGPRTPEQQTLTVHLVIAKRDTVDRALALARSAGLSPRLVIVPEPEAVANGGRGRVPLAVWQAGRGSSESTAHRRLRRGLEIAALVLALSVYAIHVYRLDRIRSDLRGQLASAKQTAAAAQALGREVKQTNDALAFFESRRNEVPPLRLLDEVTKLVPLDSWLTELAVRGRNVEISGYAPRATDLIARVDGSALFEKPQFRSAITLSPDDKGERFDLSFSIKPEPAR